MQKKGGRCPLAHHYVRLIAPILFSRLACLHCDSDSLKRSLIRQLNVLKAEHGTVGQILNILHKKEHVEGSTEPLDVVESQ